MRVGHFSCIFFIHNNNLKPYLYYLYFIIYKYKYLVQLLITYRVKENNLEGYTKVLKFRIFGQIKCPANVKLF